MQYTFALLALAAAVRASPMPQAVTAVITPSGTAPAGCMPTFAGSFGIAVHNISTAAAAKRQVTQGSDGQPAAMTVGHVSMITDGQIQAHLHTMVIAPVAQITDGQVQGPMVTMAPVTEFIDGQPQAPKVTVVPVTQISDAQPQAPAPAPTATASAVSQLSDAQPQAPSGTASAVSQISDAQPQAASTAGASAAAPSATMVACATDGTLELTLVDGILKDGKGRTGYIASNYQFQFDSPPQAGAIVTAGFSACGNGSLALGGTNVFYQCLSGNFYNLYDRNWAAQCSPVTINTLGLVNCA